MTNENYKKVDPDTHNRRRRLSAIQDARERVQDEVNEAYADWAHGETNKFAALTRIRRAVEMYIYEVEGLIKADEEHESHYWHECELGEMELPTRTKAFVGLKSIPNAPHELVDEWEETYIDDVRGKETEVQAIREQIPYDILMNAYSTVNQFCAQAGLDLNTRTTRDAAFDYSDILQEGPPE